MNILKFLAKEKTVVLQEKIDDNDCTDGKIAGGLLGGG